MMFQLAFELSLGLFLGAFVGYLPFVLLKARMVKKAGARAGIDALAGEQALDLNSLIKIGAQFMGKQQG